MFLPRFLQRYLFKLKSPALLLLLVLLAGTAVFALIMHEVLGEKDDAMDLRAFAWLSQYITPGRTAIMKGVTFAASARFLEIAYGLTMLLYLLRRNWLRSLEIFIIGLGGFAINYFMKLTFHRLRPPHPLMEPLLNFSFPSGHATSGFIFYGLLAYLVWKTKRLPRAARALLVAVLLCWALLIGFSRVYLRMHYMSDVLAGFCSGAAWMALSILILERLKKKATQETGQTEEQAEVAQKAAP